MRFLFIIDITLLFKRRSKNYDTNQNNTNKQKIIKQKRRNYSN